jgi:DNA polymerase III sliding clamp (beta) subunit (PCNA family)
MSDTMKIDAAMLAEEVAWLAKGKAASSAVLPPMHLATSPDGLCLRRTDFELYRETVLPTEGGVDAAVLVLLNPVKLASLLKGAAGYATLEITDLGAPNGVSTGVVAIEVGGRRITLRSAGDVDDFPDWPLFEPTGKPAILGAGQLARALTSVGTDDTLPMLTGVRFDDGVMASTDRFRLTAITYAEHGFSALVPSSALRPFATGTDVVTVEHGKLVGIGVGVGYDGAVQVSSGGRSIIARVLDADFPKWRQLIPTELPVAAVISRTELLDALGGDQVTLQLRADDTMTVTSSDHDGHGIDSDVSIQQQIAATILDGGDELPFTIRLNTVRLTGCVKGIAGGVLKFAASTATRPVVLTGVGEDDLHMVMPIRVPDPKPEPAADPKPEQVPDPKPEGS